MLPTDAKPTLYVYSGGEYVRPEGQGFICGACPRSGEPDDEAQVDDYSVDDAMWDDRLWPALYDRAPGVFDAARVVGAWAGMRRREKQKQTDFFY